MIVVSDTSPIRALAHLNLLDILQTLFGQVLIPPAVDYELKHPPFYLPALDLSAHPFVSVRAPQDQSRVNQFLPGLDLGEAEALALALEVRPVFILVDEKKARLAASQLGLPKTGVLGLLVKAKQNGLVPAVRPLLDDLEHNLGFFISPALRARTLSMAGE